MTDRLQQIKEMYNDKAPRDGYHLNDFKPDILYLITRLEAAEAVIAIENDLDECTKTEWVAVHEAWEESK